MKNIVIISSSPRRDGNSETLAKEFMRGAEECGHNVELIRLQEQRLGYCLACYKCTELGHCCQKDAMNDIAPKLLKADVIVFATPVYFYTMSGQLKVFLDRLVPYYTQIKADIYIIATAWDPNTRNLELTAESIRGCTRDCFEECTEKGVLLVGDVSDKGAVNSKPAMQQAYEMGKKV